MVVYQFSKTMSSMHVSSRTYRKIIPIKTLYFAKARNAAVLQSSDHHGNGDLGAGLGGASGLEGPSDLGAGLICASGLEWPSGLEGLD